jgi:hypothetical protein
VTLDEIYASALALEMADGPKARGDFDI